MKSARYTFVSLMKLVRHEKLCPASSGGKRKRAVYNPPSSPFSPSTRFFFPSCSNAQKSLLRHILSRPQCVPSFPPSGFSVDKAEHGFSLSGRLLPLFDCLPSSPSPSLSPSLMCGELASER